MPFAYLTLRNPQKAPGNTSGRIFSWEGASSFLGKFKDDVDFCGYE